MVNKNFWELAYFLRITPWSSDELPIELKDFLEKNKNSIKSYLDIGCGTGSAVVNILKLGIKSVGIDISINAIKLAKDRYKKIKLSCQFYNADITNFDQISKLNLGKFDLVTDMGCFHSLPDKDDSRQKYVNSLLSLTKVGSYYLQWSFPKFRIRPIGPLGVEKIEIERLFSNYFDIIKIKNRSSLGFGRMMYIEMLRVK